MLAKVWIKILTPLIYSLLEATIGAEDLTCSNLLTPACMGFVFLHPAQNPETEVWLSHISGGAAWGC